jgi:hypothetical protein
MNRKPTAEFKKKKKKKKKKVSEVGSTATSHIKKRTAGFQGTRNNHRCYRMGGAAGRGKE